MRIILYSGKGGVGKTTLSAVTAVRAAQLGYKTIIISTDAAHSLGDSLGIDLSSTPKMIDTNLFAQEVNVNQEIKENWNELFQYFSDLVKKRGFNDITSSEFVIFPGTEELLNLLKLRDYYQNKSYDVAIIDCAPTAGTIRMLSLPDMISWYVDRFLHIERRVVKLVKPIAERVTTATLPTDNFYYTIEELCVKVNEMKDILTRQLVTSIRLVFNPEKMVIKESQRAFTYFYLFGFNVDCVIANRILPQEISDPYFTHWKDVQQRHLLLAQDVFYPVPMFQAKLFENEVTGIQILGEMAEDIFKDHDPTAIFHSETPIAIESCEQGYFIGIKAPFADQEGIDVKRSGEELIITMGNFRRNLLLPRSFDTLDYTISKYEDGRLKIYFEEHNEEENF